MPDGSIMPWKVLSKNTVVLHGYIFEYYNVSGTHMSLEKDSPEHRPIQKVGKIKAKPILGGLHHVYSRAG